MVPFSILGKELFSTLMKKKIKNKKKISDFDLFNADQTKLTLYPSSKVEVCICSKARRTTRAMIPAVLSIQKVKKQLS